MNQLTYTALNLSAPTCNHLTKTRALIRYVVTPRVVKPIPLLLCSSNLCENLTIVYSRKVYSTDASHKLSVQT
jgi:hypothetical protein